MDTVLTFLREGGPGLAALIAVLGVLGTIIANNRGNMARLKHEERMKELELQAAEKARLRDDRIAAYRKILAASLLVEDPNDPQSRLELGQAIGEGQLVAGTKDVADAAHDIFVGFSNYREKVRTSKNAPTEDKKGKRLEAAKGLGQRRMDFLALARKELGVDD